MAKGDKAVVAHFRWVSDETQNQIDDWIYRYTKNNPPPDDFMSKYQYNMMTQKLAEEVIFPELIFIQPETDE